MRLMVGIWLAGLSNRLVRRRVQREGRLVSILALSGGNAFLLER